MDDSSPSAPSDTGTISDPGPTTDSGTSSSMADSGTTAIPETSTNDTNDEKNIGCAQNPENGEACNTTNCGDTKPDTEEPECEKPDNEKPECEKPDIEKPIIDDTRPILENPAPPILDSIHNRNLDRISNHSNDDNPEIGRKLVPPPYDDRMKNINEFGPNEKWRIYKNVIVLSLGFMVHFTAFQGAANLQSSINAEAGLGPASLASIYASLIFSNLFLPVVIINWIGCKWTVALSFIAYMPYIGSQFYPEFYTMIPAGLSVGLGGGPLWCAKCTYLSVVAIAYEKITGIPSDVITVRYFGMFFMLFQFSQVWGNLISSLVLSSGNSTGPAINESIVQEICGPNFIASDSPEALPQQPSEKINMIAGIYLGCMCLAVIIVAVGVDSLTRYEKKREGSGTGLSGIQLLTITMKLLKEKNQLLILAITIWLGLGQAFVGADYTASYVACAWGTGNIGYVMICYGLCNSASAIGTGSIVKITGRVPVVCSAMVLQIGVIIALLIWKPHPDHVPVFFLMAGLWGVCDGVWLVQINAFCGIMFPRREEAAYSNFRLWESLGFIIAYVYSPYLRTYVKLYILLVVLILGVIGYLVIEFDMKKKAKQIETPANGDIENMARTNKAYEKED